MMVRKWKFAVAVFLAAFAAACRVPPPALDTPTRAVVAPSPTMRTVEELPALSATSPAEAPTTGPESTPAGESAPAGDPTGVPDTPPLPAGVRYDLGELSVIQENFPPDSRFREMPVRLEGVLSVPDAGDGPHPVMLILHGSHAGCPLNEFGVDVWPCPGEEQLNYLGFEYLVRELAARGFVALAININAENTFGFGEPVAGERLLQIVDAHLSALATAAAGGSNGFGVALEGVADMRRLAFAGHSRGGEMANWLATEVGLDRPISYAERGYGPVSGLLLVAPALATVGTNGTNVPLAVILPACDADVVDLHGQVFYDQLRPAVDSNPPATTFYLEGAGHNGFNGAIGGDLFGLPDRPDCEMLMEPAEQQAFLVDYADAFLTSLFSYDPMSREEAAAALGMEVQAPAPDELLGSPGLVTTMAAADDRRAVFIPAGEEELTTNRLGGPVTATGLFVRYCREGYFLPADEPGSEPCKRPNLTVPGNPSMVVLGWEEQGSELSFAVPEGEGDLSRFTTLSLRAAVDPLSPLNESGEPQRFSVRITDRAGNSASVVTREGEPALRYPVGLTRDSEFFGEVFSGLVPMTTIRIPLAAFEGVEMADVAEIALVFDQTESGTLFLGDLEVVRPPQAVGVTSTLLENAGGENDAFMGIVRFNGASTCTGVFVDTGDNDGPAYLLTNGHCAQEWDANRVTLDAPAGDWDAVFNYFADTIAQQTVPATKVAYSTMKGRDLAVIELAATVGELAGMGITPLAISDTEPQGAFGMRVIGAPVTSVPEEVAFLREERCASTGRADLFEFIWHFDDALANVCRDIYGGSSGSPVFVGDEMAVVALINTTNIGGVTACALGSPCEVRPDGTVWIPDTSYATPVVGLRACFVEGLFDAAAEGCPLDAGRQLAITGQTVTVAQSPVAWTVTLEGDLPYYRYKTGRAGATDCAVDEGYGNAVVLAEDNLIDDALPPEEGSYLLCVVAGESPSVDETWQPVAWATAARLEVDNTPPALAPQLSFNLDGEGGFFFEPLFVVPELSDFLVKFGPEALTDCADDQGYERYRRIPFHMAQDQRPGRICVIGSDAAGNAGAWTEWIVGSRD